MIRAGSQSVSAQARRAALHPDAGRLHCRAVLVGPVARNEFAHPIENRTCRAKSQRGEDRKPGQHAEHVTVRRDHRMLDDMPHDLAARQIRRIDVLPVRQQRPRERLVAVFQRVANAGEMVAELAKSQRCIEHGNAPQHGERQTQRQHEQPVHAERDQRGEGDGERPCNPSMVRLAGIEIAADQAGPAEDGAVDRIRVRERPNLLQQQGAQDGKKLIGR